MSEATRTWMLKVCFLVQASSEFKCSSEYKTVRGMDRPSVAHLNIGPKAIDFPTASGVAALMDSARTGPTSDSQVASSFKGSHFSFVRSGAYWKPSESPVEFKKRRSRRI